MTEGQQPILKSRRALPSGRAVLGALLVTLAALGVLLASRLGDDATFQDVVVARQDLAPGAVIEADDVATIRIRLDEDADWVINDPAEVVGNLVVGPVAQLEFLQRSNVVESLPDSIPSGLAVVSVDLDPDHAPPSLAPGELISIYETGTDGETTRLIADRVLVVSYDTGGETSSSSAVLRLAIADGDVAAKLVRAAALADDIAVIGVNGAPAVIFPETESGETAP